jgi:hypothetical protein
MTRTTHLERAGGLTVLAWLAYGFWTHPAALAVLLAVATIPLLTVLVPYLAISGVGAEPQFRAPERVCIPGTDVCVRVERRASPTGERLARR